MKRPLPILIFSLFLLAASGLFAQTVHDVSVANFAFTPANLTIQQGDIVRWTNAGGFHSVLGSLDEFPDNPEGFGNEPASGDWMYEFTFNTEGSYDYRCGVHSGMTGQITVEGSLSIPENESGPVFVLFPNPIVDQLTWKWNDNKKPDSAILMIFDIKGEKVKEVNLLSQTQVDMTDLGKGIYTYSAELSGQGRQTGKFLITR